MPKVSAVIPSRNRPQIVRRAVQSALSQTFTDLEVVVVVAPLLDEDAAPVESAPPLPTPAPVLVDVRTYPVKVTDGTVYIEVGD